MTTDIQPTQYPELLQGIVPEDKLQQVSQILQQAQLSHAALNQFHWYKDSAESVKTELQAMKKQMTQKLVEKIKDKTGVDISDALDKATSGDMKGAANSLKATALDKLSEKTGFDTAKLLKGDVSQVKQAVAEEIAKKFPGIDVEDIARGDFKNVSASIKKQAMDEVSKRTGIDAEKLLKGDTSQLQKIATDEVSKRTGVDAEKLLKGDTSQLQKMATDEVSKRTGLDAEKLLKGDTTQLESMATDEISKKTGLNASKLISGDTSELQGKVADEIAKQVPGLDAEKLARGDLTGISEDVKQQALNKVSNDVGFDAGKVLSGDTEQLKNMGVDLVSRKTGVDAGKLFDGDTSELSDMAANAVSQKTGLDGSKILSGDTSELKEMLPDVGELQKAPQTLADTINTKKQILLTKEKPQAELDPEAERSFNDVSTELAPKIEENTTSLMDSSPEGLDAFNSMLSQKFANGNTETELNTFKNLTQPAEETGGLRGDSTIARALGGQGEKPSTSNTMTQESSNTQSTSATDTMATKDTSSIVTGGEQETKAIVKTAGKSLGEELGEDAAITAPLDESGIGEIFDAGLTIAGLATSFASLFEKHHQQTTITQGQQVGL